MHRFIGSRHRVTRLGAIGFGVVVVSAGAWLINRSPTVVLDYLRVVAWPAVALAGILLFRTSIVRLMRNLYLKEVDVAKRRLLFGQREQSEYDPDNPIALGRTDSGADPRVQDELEMLRYGARMAGALLAAYEMQLQFLRELGNAPRGLTRHATEAWFTERLTENGLDLESWDVASLVTWLESWGLLELTPEGNLLRSEAGTHLVELATSFAYAPKAV